MPRIRRRYDVKGADFRTITRVHTLPQPTARSAQRRRNCSHGALPTKYAIRLLGVGISGFENDRQFHHGLFAVEAGRSRAG